MNCPLCRHPWADHASDGCQHPIMIDGVGPYDCNCQAVQGELE